MHFFSRLPFSIFFAILLSSENYLRKYGLQPNATSFYVFRKVIEVDFVAFEIASGCKVIFLKKHSKNCIFAKNNFF